MTPQQSVAKAVVSQPNLGLCGVQPLCARADVDLEFKVFQVPRCGQCNAPEPDLGFESELIFHDQTSGSMSMSKVAQRNLQNAKTVIREIYGDLESRCEKDQKHYEETGSQPSRQKLNTWATYTNKARLQRFASDSIAFVQGNADCRTRLLTPKQLRFLIFLQHLVSEDCSDVTRPESLRKHQDAFEGTLTDCVNSQLVKDAHRSEFSVDGTSFSMQDLPPVPEGQEEERRHAISKFQTEFVTTLEKYLLAFCSTIGLSAGGTRRLIQVVTTQMSQAGLANLDRGSQASRYFVGSQGLDQRTAYNLSTMKLPTGADALKLSILCMKTGFSQYLDKDELLQKTGAEYPKRCKPASYLYQYATLSFSVGPQIDHCESVVCSVLDALDEAHIENLRVDEEEELVIDET